MTELAPPQISSLMEALPGIAAVLRSPVATAIIATARSAAGLEPFQIAHAEELLRYGVRRTLLTQDEVDKVMAELQEAQAAKPVARPVAEKPVKEAAAPKAPAAPKPAAKAAAPKAPAAKPEPRKPAAKAAVKATGKAVASKSAPKVAAAKVAKAAPRKKAVAVKKAAPAKAKKR